MRIIITQLKSGMQKLQMICERHVNIEVSHMAADPIVLYFTNEGPIILGITGT